jgi:hypothetical protein
MTREQAIVQLCDVASRWAENAEEAYPRRIKASDTDDELRKMLALAFDDYELQDVIDIRNTWQAVETFTTVRNDDPPEVKLPKPGTKPFCTKCGEPIEGIQLASCLFR